MLNPIDTILNDPTEGLIPYLEAKLNASFKNYQIKPYNFSSPTSDKTSGIRLTSFRTELESATPITFLWTQRVIIGWMIRFSDDIQSQLDISEIAAEIVIQVAHWSKCVSRNVTKIAIVDSGTLGRKPQDGISASKPEGWWMIAECSFDITYRVIG